MTASHSGTAIAYVRGDRIASKSAHLARSSEIAAAGWAVDFRCQADANRIGMDETGAIQLLTMRIVRGHCIMGREIYVRLVPVLEIPVLEYSSKPFLIPVL